MKIALSTDTSCTISKELAQKLDIKVFPLNVIVNGEEFLDGVTIDQETLCKDMRDGKIIKTSTPPPATIISYFEELVKEGYDKIIHFTISSKLSSMYQLFVNVSEEYFPGKIIVVDSINLASPMLALVLYTYEELIKGTDIETILEGIEERKKDSYLFFVPENLTALKNGGRISPAIAALGNMIGLKPLLVLKDGALDKDSMTRNIKKAINEQANAIKEKYSPAEYDITVPSFDANEAVVNYIMEQFKDSYCIKVVPVAINVCAHCGPGTLGIIVTRKINNKSIVEYLN